MVTSATLPWSTSVRNWEKLISWVLAPAPPALTTCHRRTPDRMMTSQNTTVLTVEFTQQTPNQPLKGQKYLEAKGKPHASSELDALSRIWIEAITHVAPL